MHPHDLPDERRQDPARPHPDLGDDLLDDLLDDERLDPRWLKDQGEPCQPDEPWAPTDFDEGLI